MRTLPKLPVSKHQSEFITFTGGLDTVSPPVTIPPGYIRNSLNFEEDINGGYRTLSGYEAFDGKQSPSSAQFYYLSTVSNGTIAINDTITGATSGATGKVIAIEPTRLVLTKVTGIWVTELTVSGGGSVVGPANLGSAFDSASALYASKAADVYRALISAVPGTGQILGVYYFKGVVYAFRDINLAPGVGMYKSSASGWQAVDLGYFVPFTNANVSVNDGDVLTKGAVTATINRVVVESGTLLSGVNTGRLIISTPSGGVFSSGAATTTGSGALTLSGASAAITIPVKSGRFEFVTGNFSGTQKFYGCDGANLAFEFDGSVFVPIITGNTVDTPKHIAVHKEHLFLSFGSSVQHSAIGDPYNWTAISGAVEILCKDDVTNFYIPPGSQDSPSMAIYCRNKTHMLYGTNALDWQFVTFNEENGAFPYTAQALLNKAYVFDDRGVTELGTAKEFGNFLEATISKRVKSWFKNRKTAITDAHVSRDKQQYRLFFSNGYAAYFTIGSNVQSMTPILFPNPVMCSVSAETYGGGDELMFFGSSNGFVYQMDIGTSFNGTAIDAYLDLVFNNSKAYRLLKKYRRITFEVTGEGYAEFNSTYDLALSSVETMQPDVTNNTASFATVNWDEFVWDEFVWDGKTITNLSMAVDGDGENMAIRIQSSSNFFAPLKFSGAFLEYTNLRMLR